MELNAIKKQDYQNKSATQGHSFNKTYSKVQTSYGVVPWTHSQDGLLRSGDSIRLCNKKTQGQLVCDLGVRQNNVDESYRLHTSHVH
jgi:hypothetical protein